MEYHVNMTFKYMIFIYNDTKHMSKSTTRLIGISNRSSIFVLTLILIVILLFLFHNQDVIMNPIRERFDDRHLNGEPQNIDHAAIPYHYVALNLKYGEFPTDDSIQRKLRESPLEYYKDTSRTEGIDNVQFFNSTQTQSLYNLEHIENDLKYFNNTSYILHKYDNVGITPDVSNALFSLE